MSPASTAKMEESLKNMRKGKKVPKISEAATGSTGVTGTHELFVSKALLFTYYVSEKCIGVGFNFAHVNISNA